MLAGAVDAFKRLLMQKAGIAVFVGNLLHHLHGQLVVVNGDVRGFENRSQLVLGGSDFVVFCFGGNTQLPELLIQIMHELGNLRLENAEIMILHLLSLRSGSADQCAAGHQKIFSLQIHFLVDQEIFLLGADGCIDMGDFRIAEKVQYLHGFFGECFHRTQKRRLLV